MPKNLDGEHSLWIHNLHEALIYGYNQNEEIFYFADNMKGGRYGHAEISFKELEEAEKGVLDSKILDWYNGVMLLKK